MNKVAVRMVKRSQDSLLEQLAEVIYEATHAKINPEILKALRISQEAMRVSAATLARSLELEADLRLIPAAPLPEIPPLALRGIPRDDRPVRHPNESPRRNLIGR